MSLTYQEQLVTYNTCLAENRFYAFTAAESLFSYTAHFYPMKSIVLKAHYLGLGIAAPLIVPYAACWPHYPSQSLLDSDESEEHETRHAATIKNFTDSFAFDVGLASGVAYNIYAAIKDSIGDPIRKNPFEYWAILAKFSFAAYGVAGMVAFQVGEFLPGFLEHQNKNELSGDLEDEASASD